MLGVSKVISHSLLLQVRIHCNAIVLGSAIHPKWSTSPTAILIATCINHSFIHSFTETQMCLRMNKNCIRKIKWMVMLFG